MLTRVVGFITTSLIALSVLDYYDFVQVTAPPLKQLVEAIIAIGKIVQSKLASL